MAATEFPDPLLWPGATAKNFLSRGHFLAICEDDFARAAVLSRFYYWYCTRLNSIPQAEWQNAIDKANGKEPTQNIGLWVWKTIGELVEELHGAVKYKTVAAAIHWLAERGFLHIRDNSRDSWSRTKEFLFDAAAVQAALFAVAAAQDEECRLQTADSPSVYGQRPTGRIETAYRPSGDGRFAVSLTLDTSLATSREKEALPQYGESGPALGAPPGEGYLVRSNSLASRPPRAEAQRSKIVNFPSSQKAASPDAGASAGPTQMRSAEQGADHSPPKAPPRHKPAAARAAGAAGEKPARVVKPRALTSDQQILEALAKANNLASSAEFDPTFTIARRLMIIRQLEKRGLTLANLPQLIAFCRTRWPFTERPLEDMTEGHLSKHFNEWTKVAKPVLPATAANDVDNLPPYPPPDLAHRFDPRYWAAVYAAAHQDLEMPLSWLEECRRQRRDPINNPHGAPFLPVNDDRAADPYWLPQGFSPHIE